MTSSPTLAEFLEAARSAGIVKPLRPISNRKSKNSKRASSVPAPIVSPLTKKSEASKSPTDKCRECLDRLHITSKQEFQFWSTLVDPYIVSTNVHGCAIFCPVENQVYHIANFEELVFGGFRGCQYKFAYLCGKFRRVQIESPAVDRPTSVREDLGLVVGLISPKNVTGFKCTRDSWKEYIEAEGTPIGSWWNVELNRPWSEEDRAQRVLKWVHKSFTHEMARNRFKDNSGKKQSKRDKELLNRHRAQRSQNRDETAAKFPSVVCKEFLETLPGSVLRALIASKTRKPIPPFLEISELVAICIGLFDYAYELLSRRCVPFHLVKEYSRISSSEKDRQWIIQQAVWRATWRSNCETQWPGYRQECKDLARPFAH